MDIKPYPHYIILQRINKPADSAGGVFVPRQDQEETVYAVVIDGGISQHQPGDYVVVQPHAGTDLSFDGEPITIMEIKKEVLAEVWT